MAADKRHAVTVAVVKVKTAKINKREGYASGLETRKVTEKEKSKKQRNRMAYNNLSVSRPNATMGHHDMGDSSMCGMGGGYNGMGNMRQTDYMGQMGGMGSTMKMGGGTQSNFQPVRQSTVCKQSAAGGDECFGSDGWGGK